MFFIAGLTFGLGWTASAFRDKPWLLVLGTTAVLGAAFVGILAFLQFGLNVYNGWDILFTGGYYFSANKIFGTIAEAQAPDRATLFASYGPIVMLLGVGFAVRGIWLDYERTTVANFSLVAGLLSLHTWHGVPGVSFSTQLRQWQFLAQLLW